MIRLFIVLGFIASIFAVILSVTPLSKIAYIPAIIALAFGLIALYFSRLKKSPKKSIQLVFLLTIISLCITTYKAIFNVVEVGNVESLKLKEKESEEKAIKELEELDIDDINMDSEYFNDMKEVDSVK